MSSAAPNTEQLAAIEAPGVVFVSAGAGTGKTTVLVERYVRAVCDRGLDIESILVITYTERAAGELSSRIRARLLELGRHDLARSLDGAWISTIHGFCHRLLKAHPFAAGIDPRYRVLDDSQSRVVQGEAFQQALTAFCADEDGERLRLLATYGARGLRRMVTGAFETLRSAGRPLELELPGRSELPERLEELRDAAQCLLDEGPDETVARVLELLAAAPAAEELLDLSGYSAKGRARERFATYEEARARVERAALDELARRDRDLLQQLLQSFAEAYRAAKDHDSALDFEDLQLYARDLLRDNEEIRERERWRLRSIMVDEFQDTNRLQCELIDLLAGAARVGGGGGALLRRRRVPVDLPLPPRRRPGLPGAARADRRRARADRELPVAARGARGDQPSVLGRLRHLVPAAVRRGPLPRSRFRPRCRAARHRQVDLLGHGRPLAEGRGPARRAAAARGRRRGGGHARRDRPPLRRRNRRAPVRGGAAPARPSDLPRDRPRLLLAPAGRRPARVPAAAAEPLRRRGARHRARLAVRRRVQRRARAAAARGRPAPAVRRARARPVRGGRRARFAALPGLPPALRADRRGLRLALARTAVRAGRARARLRPRRPRAARRTAPLREHAQARAARALVRGAARPRHRRLRPLRPRAGLGRRERAGSGRRGRGHRRHPPADHPRGQGARVQGGRRRRRRSRLACLARRGALPAGRPPRLQGRAPGDRQAPADDRLRGGQGRGGAGRARRAPPPLLRGDDAGDRPADRLRLDRSRPRVGRRDSDRLGARAPRPRGARARGRRAARDRPRRRAARPARRPLPSGSARRPRPSRRKRPSYRCSRPARPSRCVSRFRPFRSSSLSRHRLPTASGACPTARSRSSSAVRTAFTPSGSRGCDRRAGPGRGSRRWRPPRSATPSTVCSSGSTSRLRLCPTSSRRSSAPAIPLPRTPSSSASAS